MTFPLIGIIVVLIGYAGALIYTRWPRPEPDWAEPLAQVAVATFGVSKSIGGRTVLDDVSVSVGRGRVAGLLGPNGAGKTTLLKSLSGLATPDSGSCYILGWQVRPGAAVVSRLGVSIESPGLSPHLTGRANLEGLWRITGRPKTDAQIEQVAQLSGLGDDLARKVGGYSVGMRQRLALAQAMLGLPDVLLLDEPAQGLDPNQLLVLRTILRNYAASGRAVLISSHHLGEVEATCDDVIVLAKGRVAFSGPLASFGSPARMLEVTTLDPALLVDRLGALGISPDVAGDRVLITVPDGRLGVVLEAVAGAADSVTSIDSHSGLQQRYFAAVGNA